MTEGAEQERRIRVLIAKPGLDGHDRGHAEPIREWRREQGL